MLPRVCVHFALLVPACGATASPRESAVPSERAPQPAPVTLLAPEPSPEPSAAVREITADPDDPRSLRDLGLALNKLGEARFLEAEQKRKAALALTAPAYLGAGSEAAVAKYFGEVAQFISKRRALVDEAESAYRTILDIQPLPPPRWVVAAAERVAGLHEATALALEAVPRPPALAKSAQAQAAYESALREAVTPSRERAKLAYRACAALAVKFRVEDEHSQRCRVRLAELEGASAP